MSVGGSTATIAQSFNVPELQKRLLFMLFAIAVFVFGTHVPAPGIDHAKVADFFNNSAAGGLFSFFDMFSGGGLKRLSIFALGIMPYINASIIFQLLTAIDPKLKEIQQEGEEGRKRISKWTRYLAIALAIFQGGGLMMGIYGSIGNIMNLPALAALASVVAGTCFLMWLGDEISQKGLGNGASIVIMLGIMAQIPAQIFQELSQASLQSSRFFALVLFALLAVAAITAIVWIQLSARRVPVQYARRQIGRKVYGGQSTYLPIKIAQAGVIPIIFAVSVLMVPPTLLGFLPQATSLQAGWAKFSQSGWYLLFEFGLVFLFTFVYTAITFQTQDIADNLKKNNGFIPGIRPGKPTFDYLDRVLHRVTFFGATFLGLIAILPSIANMIIQATTHVQITALYLGGTSLLIVVGVALDTVQQMQAHLVMRHYSGFNK